MAAAIAALGLLGCGGGAEDPSGAEASSGDELAQYEGPIASTDSDRGKELFEAHCDDCHPGGEEDVGPSLIADAHTPAQLRKQIREGSGKMKPFPEKRLSDDDLEAVLAYLASINAVK
jgi:mono/diheme cytochrome c family protein